MMMTLCNFFGHTRFTFRPRIVLSPRLSFIKSCSQLSRLTVTGEQIKGQTGGNLFGQIFLKKITQFKIFLKRILN